MLVTISGPDGSGKTTQIIAIKQECVKRRLKPYLLWLRIGYTPIFSLTKGFMRKGLSGRLPQAGHSEKRSRMLRNRSIRRIWLACSLIDLVFVTAVYVRIKLWLGYTVICDRWIWDSMIDLTLYHGCTEIDVARISRLIAFLAVKPKTSFLLSLPFEIAMARSSQKDEPFPDTYDVRRKRHYLYDSVSSGVDLIVIDATRRVEEVTSEVVAMV